MSERFAEAWWDATISAMGVIIDNFPLETQRKICEQLQTLARHRENRNNRGWKKMFEERARKLTEAKQLNYAA